MATPTGMKWIAEILSIWRGLESDQMADGDSPESLAQRRYLVVEHGRDCSRRWFSAFDEIEEVLTFAAQRSREDEWAFTAAYDLETGEELKLEFHAQLAGRKPIHAPATPCHGEKLT